MVDQPSSMLKHRSYMTSPVNNPLPCLAFPTEYETIRKQEFYQCLNIEIKPGYLWIFKAARAAGYPPCCPFQKK
jgi:hypothetical protein